jgi:hypothetical protein
VSDVGQAEGVTSDATEGAADAGPRAPLLGRLGRYLLLYFPQAPAARRSRPAALWAALATLAAVAAGAWLMLARQPGHPAQDSLVADDYKAFLPGALARSWGSLFQIYDGYLQVVPRLIAIVVAKLPLREAAAGFAITAAVITACCAVFVFYACSGHVRAPALRVLLAASVILLPTALVEIANNGANSPWYLMFATFWALLWRPRSLAAAITAALVCFAAAASNVMAALFLPLAAARVIALPRVRENIATIGLLAGGALQLPAVLTLSRNHQGTTLARAFAFYGHLVILPAAGGHNLAALLWARAGLGAATLIAAAVVIAVAAWACLRAGAAARLFVLTALLLGLLLTLVAVLVHGTVANLPLTRTELYVRGSRYGQVPILLMYAALIVAVDAYLRRGRFRPDRAAHALAALVLVAVLAPVWVSDFRYTNARAVWQPWSSTVAQVVHHCQRTPRQPVHVLRISLPCSRLVGVSAPRQQ